MEAAKHAVDADSSEGPSSKRVCATGQSTLEKLPKELVWKVIEYVPETVLQLRKTSTALKAQVDDFAVAQSMIPVVGKLSFSDARLPNSNRPPSQLDIIFDIPADKVDLFYLRLHLQQLDFKEHIKKMRCSDDKEEEKKDLFDMKFDTDEEETQLKLQFLSEFMGKRVAKVEILNCAGEKRLAAIDTVLEDKLFSKLKIIADDMPEEVVRHMLQTMVEHNVQELSLAGKFETTVDTVSLLRQISSHVHAMQIYQTPNEKTPRLLGAQNVDWASIIIDLFSGPLDKLAIANPTYPNYLSATGTDKLIDTLPELAKKVWFVATCDQYAEGLNSDRHKGYLVTVNPPPAVPAPQANQPAPAAPSKPKQYLRIMHETRVNEPYFDKTTIDVEPVEAK